ncbi:MAG: HAD-IIB family hydrolase [Cellulosilyticaceae bacterium]
MSSNTQKDKKVLYITDLDGTLLNAKGFVSEYTKIGLTKLINEGLYFSVATARTPATVVDLLRGIPMKVPIVVMNGTALYDSVQNKYLEVQYIDEIAVRAVNNIIKSHHQNAFIYTIEKHQLTAYYKNIETQAEQLFYEERKDRYLKKFIKGDIPEKMAVAYFTMLGNKDKIEKIAEELQTVPGISQVFYPDVYDKDTYYLEVYHETVSKAAGIIKLRQYEVFDKIISFGDNLNDQPMFTYSDECYAVDNAKEALKEMATAVIESNEQDGVIKFLEKM